MNVKDNKELNSYRNFEYYNIKVTIEIGTSS